MKKKPVLTLMALATLFIVSCKNATKGLIIPKDAAMVVYIDGSSLTSKLSWNDIKSSEWFKKQYDQEKDDYKKKLMDDPEASGVNIKSDFVFFLKKLDNGAYNSFEGNLKDAAAFEKFTTTMEKDKKVEKDGDLSFVRLDETSVLTWDKSKFVFLSNDHTMQGDQEFFPKGNNTMQPPPTRSLSADTLVVIAKDLFDLSGSKLLNDDDRFASLIKETGDVHIWMNNEQYMSGLPGGMLSMLKIGDLMKGNITASTLSFDNGKITFDSKGYMNEQLAKIFNDHKAAPINADLIDRIPSQNVCVAFAFNMPSDAAKVFMQTAGVDGLANMALTRFGTNIDEVINAYKGEMLFAASDVAITEKEEKMEGMNYSFKTKKPDGNFLVAIAVKNRPSFEKLLNLAKQNLFEDSSALSKFSYKLNDQWFALSNSAQKVDSFLAGGNNKLPFTSKISGHPFCGYIDLQKIIPVAKSFMFRSSDSAARDSVWQDVVITGGEFKDGAVVSHMEVNLMDKSTNSLKQLYNFGSKMFKTFAEGNHDQVLNDDDVRIDDHSDSLANTINKRIDKTKETALTKNKQKHK